jgi:hypothetical protein
MADLDNVVDPPYRFDPYMTLTEVGWGGKEICALEFQYATNQPLRPVFEVKITDIGDVHKFSMFALPFSFPPTDPPVKIENPNVSKEMFSQIAIWNRLPMQFTTGLHGGLVILSGRALVFLNLGKIRSLMRALKPPTQQSEKITELKFTISLPPKAGNIEREPIVLWYIYNGNQFGYSTLAEALADGFHKHFFPYAQREGPYASVAEVEAAADLMRRDFQALNDEEDRIADELGIPRIPHGTLTLVIESLKQQIAAIEDNTAGGVEVSTFKDQDEFTDKQNVLDINNGGDTSNRKDYQWHLFAANAGDSKFEITIDFENDLKIKIVGGTDNLLFRT